MAEKAKTETATHFDTQQAAQDGNPGFASGPALMQYATVLQRQMEGFIDDLAANAGKIVTAAQSVETTDADAAQGFNRELAALNGLSQPATPGT
ncbi:hypothetical protein [Mycolicibacterium sp. P1-18]|uniref:hypothetical protein n=1 Tax=Mycolicibacterium sp. P1-18 TaxID=2024615 RepID=UPI001F5BA433|nr:hypothetical protein [Mycolicibacterium sp. P1-18]